MIVVTKVHMSTLGVWKPNRARMFIPTFEIHFSAPTIECNTEHAPYKFIVISSQINLSD